MLIYYLTDILMDILNTDGHKMDKIYGNALRYIPMDISKEYRWTNRWTGKWTRHTNEHTDGHKNEYKKIDG